MILAPLGTASFNDWLSTSVDELATSMRRVIGRNLAGLVLGGGYGRGEGAVVRHGDDERPYNDLDLTLIVNHRRIPRRAMARVTHEFEQRLGIDVDVSRPHTLAGVRRWRPCLMFYDLMNGHRVLAGSPDLLWQHAPLAVTRELPAIEATRLLLNRGAGLLLALRHRQAVDPLADPDFVRRNYQKCALALGDAVLIAHSAYQPAATSRSKDLGTLASRDESVDALKLTSLYDDALTFKRSPDSRPDAPSTENLWQLADRWREVWLHVEARRTGLEWQNTEAYVAWSAPREVDPVRPVRRALYAAANLKQGRLSTKHPRESLYRWLPPLLTRPSTLSTWREDGQRFLRTWERYR